MLRGATGSVVVQVDAIGGFASKQPLAALAVVVAVVALVGIGWWGLRHLRRTPGGRFQRLLSQHDAITVLMHPNPDPDAMASAMAATALAEDAGTDATIQYPGQIRRQENRAFQTVLDQDFQSIETAGDLADDPVVLVDHNEPRGFPGADGVDPIAVVDHHPGDGEGESFTDVRADYGSCATIFAEYFEDLEWTPNNDGDQSLTPIVATGMMYGIQSDTNHLTKGCSPAEFEAASYLYHAVDGETLDRVANPPVDAEVLDVKARAITNREVRSPFAVSDVDEVDNVDAIPQAATELLRLEGVTAVVVLGTCDGTLHLSGRSGDDRVHMGKALKAAVEDIPMAEAGGHARMGGGQLSVDHMEGIGPGDGVSFEEFTDRLFEAMTGELQ
jgi:nanoRNase/pAp phosphatase (c-di-AMP/oligoRNAs hydrolase)